MTDFEKFYTDTDKDYSDELGFKALVGNYVWYSDIPSLLNIMETFLAGKMDVDSFIRKFFDLWGRANTRIFSLQELIHIGTKLDSKKFDRLGLIFCDVFSACENFEPDASIGETDEVSEDDSILRSFDVSEEELRTTVKDALFKLKKDYSSTEDLFNGEFFSEEF